MDWARVKTIMITLLFCVNIFLAAAYIRSENSRRAEELLVRSEVSAILSGRGIKASEEIIPLDSVKIYPLIVDSSGIKKREIAKNLLGEVTENVTELETVYTGEKGNVLFSGNMFSAVFSVGYEVESRAQAKRIADSVVRKLGISADDELTKETENDGGYEIVYAQTVSKIRVFDCDIAVNVSKNGNVIAHGKLFDKGRTEQTREAARLVSALMLDFADLINTGNGETVEIHGVELGYFGGEASERNVLLTPVIRVITDKESIYINAMTGRKEEL